ncbi:hypothetical protein EVAR_28221_1 [Eumeta japonica]|uniref:Uncharacterized protein n=1 Tax=Eumeta variegata TaxID=151549 RepID=A0A4C1VJ49_EUMVA|nr:hypothetical protein EVAR_28221_1 [Eumeta japonica]
MASSENSCRNVSRSVGMALIRAKDRMLGCWIHAIRKMGPGGRARNMARILLRDALEQKSDRLSAEGSRRLSYGCGDNEIAFRRLYDVIIFNKG